MKKTANRCCKRLICLSEEEVLLPPIYPAGRGKSRKINVKWSAREDLFKSGKKDFSDLQMKSGVEFAANDLHPTPER